MAVPTRARCPSCRKPVPTEPGKRPKDFPFCSERCRLQDLHKWFTGEYRIPVAPAPVEDEMRVEDGISVEDE